MATYKQAYLKYPKEQLEEMTQQALHWERKFQDLRDQLKPMIQNQREMIQLTKANMDLKSNVFNLERELKVTRERQQVELDGCQSNLKNMGHMVEEMLQNQGQSRGTSLLYSSLAMGDADRIGRVIKERSNYHSSSEKTPAKPLKTVEQKVRGPKVAKRHEDTRESTGGRRSEGQPLGSNGTPASTKFGE